MSSIVQLYRLDGRTALITGAARGIGTEIARVMSALGARVAMADILPEDAWDQSAIDLARDTQSTRHRLDISNTDDCDAVVADVAASFGGIDILVNNAGINARQPAESTDDATWQRLIDTNLGGAFRMARAAYPHLAASAAPAIVNLVSTAALIAVKNNIPYGVAKAGLVHMTKILALEWADRGLRVNAVAPTIVDTDMIADVRFDPDYMKAKMATIPMGRMPTVTDVAMAVAFLASPAAGMITGQVLAVDGGVTTQ